MVDISVIIVSWNAKHFLDACLHSLYSTEIDYTLETIVVDNASTDGAPDLVEEKYQRVKVIRNKTNLGFAKANNIGLAESKGEYVCLINSDVVILGDCIKSMLAHMMLNAEIGILGPKILNSDYSLQLTCRKFPSLWDSFCRALALDKIFGRYEIFGRHLMSSWAHNETREVDYISGCFMMARRVAVEMVGFLDDKFYFYAEDRDWCKRFWLAGWKVVYFPDALAIHHLYGSSGKDPVKFYIQEVKAGLQYYDKHCSRFDKMIFIGIIVLHQIIRLIGLSVFTLTNWNNKKNKFQNRKKYSSCLLWLLGKYNFK